MWGINILLGIIGISAGAIVAGGLFSFIVGLGVISDFADRTHTGKYILLYQDSVALGGIIGNLIWIYQITIPGNMTIFFGLFSGIFTGCWAMALAEMLDVFPIFVRRFQAVKYISHMILATAIGKGVGALIFFANRW